MGERPGRGHARGLGDALERGEHATGEKPPSDETEHEQERQHRRCPWGEDVQQVGADGKDAVDLAGLGVQEDRAIGDVAQEEHPDRREQEGAGEHEEGRRS